MKIVRAGIASGFLVSLAAALAGCNAGSTAPAVATVAPSTGEAPGASGDVRGPIPLFNLQSPGTFVVSTTDDATDAQPGDGLCASAAGQCTLRAAVQEINASVLLATHGDPRMNIIVPAGHYRITLAPPRPSVAGESASNVGQMSLVASANIRGAGAGRTILDGNGLDRLFAITTPATLSITDVTMTGGVSSAIWNEGRLHLNRVVVTGNRGLYGGGIFNTPTSSMVMENSTVSDNVAEDEAGGIRCDATCLIVNSTISGNRVLPECCTESTRDGASMGEGGGIDSRTGGAVTIINSTIVNNHAVTGGGGINSAVSYQGDPAGNLNDKGIIGRPTELFNTIVAGNTSDRGPANCKHTISEIHSYGGNIADDDSCGLDAPNDLVKTAPQLGSMGKQPNGVEGFPPNPGSPARGNGLAIHCPTIDAAGVLRGDRCDSGALQAN